MPRAKNLSGRAFATLVLCVAATLLHGQASGFNFTIGYGPGLVKVSSSGRSLSTALGLAFQHDFGQRFGVALDFFLTQDRSTQVLSNDWTYSAKYFLSDNDETAFYIGSFLGFQHLKGTVEDHTGLPLSGIYPEVKVSKVQFPVGLRAGVRGGLGGYFAELFAQAGYAIGNGGLHAPEGLKVSSSSLYLTVGFSFLGFGWEHHRDR